MNYGVGLAFAAFVTVVPFVAGAGVGYLVLCPFLGACLVGFVVTVGLRRWVRLDRAARRASAGVGELLCTFAGAQSSDRAEPLAAERGWVMMTDSDLVLTLSTARGDVVRTLSWPLADVVGAQCVTVSSGWAYSDLRIDLDGGETVTLSTNQHGGWNIRPMSDADVDRLAGRITSDARSAERAQ